ncbi:MAG: ABC transporter ATP-binding protein [Bacilli bacterium]|nr:ABC transporter ATP-binding protein [Bacilli bacterium]
MVLLDVKNINVYYGHIHALKDLSLHVDKGNIVTLIGANGAGKTTLLTTISGINRPTTGTIEYNYKDVTYNLEKVKPHKIVALKLTQVPEGRQVFSNLTVDDNLEMGAYLQKDKQHIKELKEKMYRIFPRLLERKSYKAGTLSGGEQQMLAIARALMAEPELLLLDEPSMGLSPLFVQDVFNIIKKINETGQTILLVEQNANMALKIADYAYVLETGKIVLEGYASELLSNADVKKAYLGA